MTQRIHAITLLVADYDASIAWFREKLGFDLIEDADLGGGKRWVLVGPHAGGTRLLLAQPTDQRQRAALGLQAGGRVMGFLQTEDFAADHARMSAAGVVFEEAPRREPYGTVAIFRDISGNRWDLIEYADR